MILIDGYHVTPAPALIVVFSFQIHYNQLRNPVFSSIKMVDTVKCPHCKIKLQKSLKSIHVRGDVLTCWMPSWTCHYGSRPDGVEGSHWPSIWSLRPLLLYRFDSEALLKPWAPLEKLSNQSGISILSNLFTHWLHSINQSINHLPSLTL